VEYTSEDGSKHPFYVDFVIRLKNGKIFLFNTKSRDSEPLTAPLKHNALIDYIATENAKGGNIGGGGVIVKDGSNWRWSHFHIENTNDLESWDAFYPTDENLK
jgi:type III restriction enzyme